VRIGVLISGSGTNLQALLDAEREGALAASVSLVISNKPDAGGLARARASGVEALVLSHRDYASREGYDAALVAALRAREVELVVLAGFMRIVTPVFLDAFPHRVLNVHPSLLPAFAGIDAQAQAIAAGVRVSGATVHLVDAGMDTGPILAQTPVPVFDHDTIASLQARILREEHRLLVGAVNAVATERVRVVGRRVTFVEP
jgi:phosphoribosylglycinamide formyltransferase-1